MNDTSNLTQKERIEKRIELCRSILPDAFLLHQMRKDGYFIAPAAAKHHGNHEGGLFEHSFAVATTLVKYTNDLGLHWQKEDSPIIVGLLHDYCKTKLYTKQADGTYTHTGNPLLPGHGEASVMLLQQFMSLTEEELMCIRWHMGAFEGEQAWAGYSAACKAYNNVLYTHTADMYASQCLGV